MIYIFLEKVKRFCLLDAGRECKPNDPKCSRAVGVKLKGAARKIDENLGHNPRLQSVVIYGSRAW